MEKRRNPNRKSHRMTHIRVALPFLLLLASCSPVTQTQEEWRKQVDKNRPQISWVGLPSATNMDALQEQGINAIGETELPIITVKKDGGLTAISYAAKPREWWEAWKPKYKTVPTIQEGEGKYTITATAKYCKTSPSFGTYCSTAETIASVIYDKTPPNAVIRTIEQRGGKLIVTYETRDAGVGDITVTLAGSSKKVDAAGLVTFEVLPTDTKEMSLTTTSCDSLGNCGTQNSTVKYDPFSLISIDSTTTSLDGKIYISGNLHDHGNNLKAETMTFTGKQEWRMPNFDSLSCNKPEIDPKTWSFTVVCEPPSKDGYVTLKYTIKDANEFEQEFAVKVSMPDASQMTKTVLISFYSTILLSFMATGGTFFGISIKKQIEKRRRQEARQKLDAAFTNGSVADGYKPLAYLYDHPDRLGVDERDTYLENWRTELKKQIATLLHNRDVSPLQNNPLLARVLKEVQEQDDTSWFWRDFIRRDPVAAVDLRSQLYDIRLVILALEHKIGNNRVRLMKQSPHKKGDRAGYMIRTLCDWGQYAEAYKIIDGIEHSETRKIRKRDFIKLVRKDVLVRSWNTGLSDESLNDILQSCSFISREVKQEICLTRAKLLRYKYILSVWTEKFAHSPLAMQMLNEVQSSAMPHALTGDLSSIDHLMRLLVMTEQLISGSLQWDHVRVNENDTQDVVAVFQILHQLKRYDLTEKMMESSPALSAAYRDKCGHEVNMIWNMIEQKLGCPDLISIKAAERLLLLNHLPIYMHDHLKIEIRKLKEQLENANKLIKDVKPILAIYVNNGFQLTGDDMPPSLSEVYKAVATRSDRVPHLLMDIAKHVPYPQSVSVLKAIVALYEMPLSGIIGIIEFKVVGRSLVLKPNPKTENISRARKMHPNSFATSPWTDVQSEAKFSADSPQGKAIVYFYSRAYQLLNEAFVLIKNDGRSASDVLAEMDMNLMSAPGRQEQYTALYSELFEHLLGIKTLAIGESILKKIDEKLRRDVCLW
jgi:hypothetical protein